MNDVISAIEIIRKTRLVCKNCYLNQGGFSGQMITEWVCNRCGGKHRHHNTAVPKICKDCIIKLNLCEDCGTEKHIYQEATK